MSEHEGMTAEAAPNKESGEMTFKKKQADFWQALGNEKWGLQTLEMCRLGSGWL